MLYQRLQIAAMVSVVTCLGGFAHAVEQISLFEADISLSDYGTARIVERVEVSSEGKKFRHGVYRDLQLLPHQTLSVVAATFDSRPVPHRVEAAGNATRIYLVDPNRALTPGEHRYTLEYVVASAIRESPKSQEFRWNVTGSDWPVAIERATCRLHLPESVEPATLQYTGYRGAAGAADREFYARAESPRELFYSTTAPLKPGEGLTVHIAVPSGSFRLPERPARLTTLDSLSVNAPEWMKGLLSERGVLLTRDDAKTGALVAIVFLYFLVAWVLVGRDPTGGPVLPTPKPPEGVSPAVMRYLRQLRYDPTTFAVALISMAVQGHLIISRRGEQYEIELGRTPRGDLTKDERLVSQALGLHDGNRLHTRAAFATPFARASRALEEYLEHAYKKDYFARNSALWLLGVVGSVAALMIASFMVAGGEQGFGLWLFSSGLLLCIIYGLHAARGLRAAKKRARKASPNSERRWKVLVWPTIIASTLCSLAIAQATMLALLGWPAHVMWTCLLAACCLVFGTLLPARSPLGRRALDRIEGFQIYLEGKSESLREHFNSETERARAFARYMPYSVALGVEEAWASHFMLTLSEAGLEDERRRISSLTSGAVEFLFDPVGQRLDEAVFVRALRASATDPHLVSRSGTFSDATSGFSGGLGGGSSRRSKR